MRFNLLPGKPVIFSLPLRWADDFALTTNAFLDAGMLPVLYTCDGKEISPQISWSNPPEKTQSFALVMSDPDVPAGNLLSLGYL